MVVLYLWRLKGWRSGDRIRVGAVLKPRFFFHFCTRLFWIQLIAALEVRSAGICLGRKFKSRTTRLPVLYIGPHIPSPLPSKDPVWWRNVAFQPSHCVVHLVGIFVIIGRGTFDHRQRYIIRLWIHILDKCRREGTVETSSVRWSTTFWHSRRAMGGGRGADGSGTDVEFRRGFKKKNEMRSVVCHCFVGGIFFCFCFLLFFLTTIPPTSLYQKETKK